MALADDGAMGEVENPSLDRYFAEARIRAARHTSLHGTGGPEPQRRCRRCCVAAPRVVGWRSTGASHRGVVTVNVAASWSAYQQLLIRSGSVVARCSHSRMAGRLVPGIMYADSEPLQLGDSFYPLEIVGGTKMMRPADIMEGTDQVLEDLGHTPTRYEDEITWRMPTAEEATKASPRSGRPGGSSSPDNLRPP